MKKCLLALTVMFASFNSYAEFSSKEELFNAFQKVGLKTVIEISDLSSARNLFVYQATPQGQDIRSINEAQKVEVVSELDYNESGFMKKTKYSAFIVFDIVLCYSTNNHGPSLSMLSHKNDFEQCYLLPNKVREVAQRIRAL